MIVAFLNSFSKLPAGTRIYSRSTWLFWHHIARIVLKLPKWSWKKSHWNLWLQSSVGVTQNIQKSWPHFLGKSHSKSVKSCSGQCISYIIYIIIVYRYEFQKLHKRDVWTMMIYGASLHPKKTGKISIFFEDLSKNSVFFENRSETFVIYDLITFSDGMAENVDRVRFACDIIAAVYGACYQAAKWVTFCFCQNYDYWLLSFASFLDLWNLLKECFVNKNKIIYLNLGGKPFNIVSNIRAICSLHCDYNPFIVETLRQQLPNLRRIFVFHCLRWEGFSFLVIMKNHTIIKII